MKNEKKGKQINGKIKVDSLEFSFPTEFQIVKYDDDIDCFKNLSSSMQFPCECEKCPSHNCQKDKCDNYVNCNKQRKNEGLKGADLIAVNNLKKILYIIESKDYRKVSAPPVDHIANEVAKKFRDTLFGIWSGSICEEDTENRNFLYLARTKPYNLQFIFHFESPTVPYKSGLYRASISGEKKIVSLLQMQEKLDRLLGPMKNHLMVCDINSKTEKDYPWSVSER